MVLAPRQRPLNGRVKHSPLDILLARGPGATPQPKEHLPLGAGAPAPQTQPLKPATLSLLHKGRLLPSGPQAPVGG